MDQIVLKDLEKHLAFFHKLYDVVRLVDPIEKTVLEYRDGGTLGTSEICHAYWRPDGICDNCISVRAYYENKSFMKLERLNDLIMLVTAMPIEKSKKPVVLELLKNASDTMLTGDGDYRTSLMLRDFFEELTACVISDPLTGMRNRRFVTERLPADISKSLMEGWPLSVVFLDVDNLKGVNDTHGHAYGDQVIQSIARVILDNIRSGLDWGARIGGDEFVICLVNTAARDAYRVSERIRLAAMNLTVSDKALKTTVSMGIYSVFDTPITPDELIRQADLRMYEAKKNGRNRVFCDHAEASLEDSAQ